MTKKMFLSYGKLRTWLLAVVLIGSAYFIPTAFADAPVDTSFPFVNNFNYVIQVDGTTYSDPGSVTEGFYNGFSANIGEEGRDTTSGNLVQDYGVRPLLLADQNGNLDNWASGMTSRYSTDSSYSATQAGFSGRALDGTNMLEGPNGTVLEGAVLTCTNGTVSTLVPQTTVDAATGNASVSFGNIDTRGSSNNCTISFNFVEPSSSSGAAAQSTSFSGSLTISPPQRVVQPGGTAPYTATFRSLNGYTGPVYIHYISGCPATVTCRFTPSNSTTQLLGNVAANGTLSATFNAATTAATPLGSYPFVLRATPTNSPSDSSRVDKQATLVVSVSAADFGNRAKFISYEYSTNGGSTWTPFPAVGTPLTLDPARTYRARVTFANTGSRPWVRNSGGASCLASPVKNGYSLRPDPNPSSSTWGVNEVTNGLPASAPQYFGQGAGGGPGVYPPPHRYLVLALNAGAPAGNFGITDMKAYDENGDEVFFSDVAYWNPGATDASHSPTMPSLGANFAGGPTTRIQSAVFDFNGYSGRFSRIDLYITGGSNTWGVDILGTNDFTDDASSNPSYGSTMSYRTINYQSFSGYNQWSVAATGNVGANVQFVYDFTTPNEGGTSHAWKWAVNENCIGAFAELGPAYTINLANTGCSVQLTANGSHGGTVSRYAPLTLSWESTGATSLSAPGGGTWPAGARTGPNGSMNRDTDTSTAGTKTYTINCTSASGATNSDTVVVQVVDMPVCNVHAVGNSQLLGCAYSWQGNAAAFTPDPAYSNGGNYFAVASTLPARPTSALSSPVPASAVLLNNENMETLSGETDRFITVQRGRFNFNAGTYRFSIDSDDGSALYIDQTDDGISNATLVPGMDYWTNHAAGSPRTADVTFAAGGVREINFMYYDNTLASSAYLAWSPIPPNPPENVQVFNTGAGVACEQIRVTWQAPSSGPAPTGYRVYRKPSAAAAWSQVGPDQGGSTFAYLDTSPLNPNGSNFYAVTSLGAGGSESTPPTAAPSSITPVNCNANLSSSDKDIIAVNGVAVSGSPAVSSCSGVTELPSTQTFKIGDVVTFRINVCNTGPQYDATNITIVDTLKNLRQPAAGWNARYNGTAVTPTVTGSVPEQTLTFNLTAAANNVAPGGVKSLVFDAEIVAPAAGSTYGRFQNSFVINYRNNPSNPTIYTKPGTTPPILYFNSGDVPDRQEVAP